jgi:Holliday junction resolvase RusA-like endonuclease
MRSVTFTFNLEPTPKGRPRGRIATSRATGRQFVQEYTPSATVRAEQLIRAQVQLEGAGEFFEAHCPLRAVIEFVVARPPSVPKKRRWPTTKPDLDNTEKLIEDALERFLYSNDAQIVEVSKRKVYGWPPCIRLYLCEAEPEPDPTWWERMTEETCTATSYVHAGLRAADVKMAVLL